MSRTGLTDQQLIALNIYQEARGEPDDGRAAIARVTLNRTRLRYESDGTVEGTVLGDNQFSWTQWDMIDGKYKKVAHTPEAEVSRVRSMWTAAEERYAPTLSACETIAAEVLAGTYSGASYRLLTDETVSYFNPAACRTPDWAVPDKLVCRIGHHWFYCR